MNPNQRIGQPFGDVFTPNTSHTDRLAERFYIEQKQREAIDAQMAAVVDNEFAKNLSNVRDIDIPEITNLYKDYKAAVIDGMKNGTDISPERQMGILQKKAAMYQGVQKSRGVKDYEENVLKKGVSDPDSLEDNWQEKLFRSRKTPMGDESGILNYDYSYKGANKNMQDILKKAQGSLNETYWDKKNVDKDGLQTAIIPYSYGSSPKSFYESVFASMGEREAAKAARHYVKNTSPDVIIKTQELYNNIPKERLERMGLKEIQNLDISPEDTYEQVYAKHQAQLYALNNEPKKEKESYVTNKSVERAQDMADWMKKNSVTFAQSMSKIRANKGNGQPMEDLGYISDNVFADLGEEVDADLGAPKIFLDKTKVDPERLETIVGFTTNDGTKRLNVKPVKRYDSKTGTWREGYYQDQETGDIIGKDGQRASREAAKDRYVSKYSPTKFKSKINTQASEAKGGTQKPSAIIKPM